MGIMSSNIFGPTGSANVKDSGESGHHYYKIVADRDILVNEYQQYVISDRNYLDIEGTIEVLQTGEVIVEDY